MTRRKTIVFHDLCQARQALEAAREHGQSITLRTAPGAAAYAGVGYLKAVIERAGADEAIIDCGGDAGVAMAALRAGWKLVMFSGRKDVFVKLAQIAEQQGARVVAGDRQP